MITPLLITEGYLKVQRSRANRLVSRCGGMRVTKVVITTQQPCVRRSSVRALSQRLGAPLTAVVAIALVAGIGGCGSNDAPQHQAQVPHTPVPPPPISQNELVRLPESTTFTSLVTAPHDPAPQAETDGTVLHPLRELVAYDVPGGKPVARLPTTEVGSPTWVPVVNRAGPWQQVLLPSRPNSSTGWVDAGADQAALAHSSHRVIVDRGRFLMTVTHNGQTVGEWTVGIGKPHFPTPPGRTFIMASIAETVSTYSPLILPLGWHSDSHETFGGGPGTVALHGWPDASPFGKASSDGCIRVPPDALQLLSTLPLGTMVFIR